MVYKMAWLNSNNLTSKLEFSEKSWKQLSFPTFPFDLFRASNENDLRERELLPKRFADSCITQQHFMVLISYFYWYTNMKCDITLFSIISFTKVNQDEGEYVSFYSNVDIQLCLSNINLKYALDFTYRK